MTDKLKRAREAVATQSNRNIACPYCGRRIISVYSDTRGHIQTKCSKCGNEYVLDIVNMRHTETCVIVHR